MADYDINAVTRRQVFSGSAGTGPYSFTFQVLDSGDVAVYKNATKLTITTNYTVTVNANGTGSVTLTSAATSSDTVTIIGARDIERTTDFVTAGDLRASALNEQLDGQIIMIQQIAEENKRQIIAPINDPEHVDDGGTLDMTLPSKDDRKGKYLAFDATTGNPSVREVQTQYGDNQKIILGDSSDMSVYHDGSNSYVSDTGAGYLLLTSDGPGVRINSGTAEVMGDFVPNGAVTLYYDNSAKIATTAAGINVTGTVTDDGATHDGDVTFTGASYNAVWDKSNNYLIFQDNAKAVFGDSAELSIFSNGTNSVIQDSGTGHLYISSTDLFMTNAAISQNYITAVDGGAVTLHHAGSAKIASTSSGVNVTGNVQLSGGLSLSGNLGSSGQILSSTGSGLQWVSSSTPNLEGGVVINEAGASVDFRVESDNNTHMLFVDGSADAVGINTSAPAGLFHINAVGTSTRLITFEGDLGTNNNRTLTLDTPSSDSTTEPFFFNTGNSIAFGIDGTEHLRLDASGNVSIGTTSASGLLTVSKSHNGLTYSDVSNTSTTAGSDGVLTRLITSNNAGSGTVSADIIKRKNGQFGLINNETDSGAIFYHTLGTTEMMRHTATETNFNDNSADLDFRVESNGNTHMLFVDGGNDRVGIANSAPATELDVNGTVKISGGLNAGGGLGTSGQVLTSTGSGINWTTPASAGVTGSGANDRVAVWSGSSSLDSSANLTFDGSTLTVNSVSKGSGSFKIDHPLPAKSDTHHLVHSFVEGPQADLIYRGRVDLVDGSAVVNIDTAAGMTDGTFAVLCTDVQCFTSNESGWTAVKGSVSGNTLTITAQDSTCTDTISWMVVGERQDPVIHNSPLTDDNGKIIVEPLKPTA